MTDHAPLDRLERMKQLLADDLSQPLKDGAGNIIPQGVDAHHRAAGKRQLLAVLNEEPRPDIGHNINEVSHG